MQFDPFFSFFSKLLKQNKNKKQKDAFKNKVKYKTLLQKNKLNVYDIYCHIAYQ